MPSSELLVRSLVPKGIPDNILPRGEGIVSKHDGRKSYDRRFGSAET